MSDRLEWELVPRVRPEKQDEVEVLAEEILALDAALEQGGAGLTEEDEMRLVELHNRMAECLLSPCEAAGSPLLSARPDFEEEASSTYEDLPERDRITREQFLQLMGFQHDCAQCDGKSDFPGVSGAPCEFDLTPLQTILADPVILDAVQFELQPEEMRHLAYELELRVHTGDFAESGRVDSREYLLQMVRYLRFWAQQGFGLAPAFVDEG